MNYRFGFTKEIKGNEAEKSWGLDELQICQKITKKKKKKKKTRSPYSESLTRFTIMHKKSSKLFLLLTFEILLQMH